MSYTADYHKRIIDKYKGRWGDLSDDEKVELESAYEGLKSIQERCTHSFKEETLFIKTTRICRYCDYEDRSSSS